jgi:hypothetical protein
VTGFVLTATDRLVDEVIEFVGSGALPEEGDDDMAVIRAARRHVDDRRLAHESRRALVADAAEAVVCPDERDRDGALVIAERSWSRLVARRTTSGTTPT